VNNLLLEIQGNNYINRTIFPHKLFLYDDILLYSKRRFLRVKEVTIAYSHIVQVDLLKGVFFSTINIVNTGVDPIIIRGIPNKVAVKAKKIMDQKIHTAHAKHQPAHLGAIENEVDNYEKYINRLNELLQRGKISQREYNKKRSEILENME